MMRMTKLTRAERDAQQAPGQTQPHGCEEELTKHVAAECADRHSQSDLALFCLSSDENGRYVFTKADRVTQFDDVSFAAKSRGPPHALAHFHRCAALHRHPAPRD
jgi:hypothetical protein